MRQQRSGKVLRIAAALITVIVGAGIPAARAQSVYDVNFQSLSPLTGTLFFDLINGDAAANNTVSITSTSFGSVLLTESDPSEFFLSADRAVTSVTNLAFRLTLSERFAGGTPDEFAFSFFNTAQTLPVVPTSDPTGANALFVIDITGRSPGVVQTFSPLLSGVTYSVTPAAVANPVPEPGAALTTGAFLGMVGLALLRQRRRRTAALAN